MDRISGSGLSSLSIFSVISSNCLYADISDISAIFFLCFLNLLFYLLFTNQIYNLHVIRYTLYNEILYIFLGIFIDTFFLNGSSMRKSFEIFFEIKLERWNHFILLLKFMKEQDIDGENLEDSGFIAGLKIYPFLNFNYFCLFGG